MSNPKVRYAVVGLGNIAQVAVLPAFSHAKTNSQLVALVSSDADKRAKLGKRYGVDVTGDYDDLEDVLRRAEVHAVYVTVPNALHRQVSGCGLQGGGRVLCEKPLATTEEDCRALMDLARARQVKLMVAYRLHFEAANLAAIERIAAGDIGTPRLFSSVFTHQVRAGNVRTIEDLGGGAIFDMGIYCINAARCLFQEEPVEVIGQTVRSHDPRFHSVDEMTSALLYFPGDRVAQLTVSQGAADVSEFRVIGTKGDIRLDPAYEYARKLHDFVTIDGHTTSRLYPNHDQFAPELLYFSRCILEGLEPEPSAEEGIADVRVIQAILRSAQTGVKVRLPYFARTNRPHASQRMNVPPVEDIKTIHAPGPTR